MPQQAALFLDRDGVIIENRENYVRSWADVEIYPQAVAALSRIAAAPYKIVLVTNQSMVGRGLVPLVVAEAINRRLCEVIATAGGRIDGVYMCPHAPADGCGCRKPRPGMLLAAAAELDIDLGRSIMIGDALTDVAAGQAAGVQRTVLLKTGRGVAQAAKPEAADLGHFDIFETLNDALAALV